MPKVMHNVQFTMTIDELASNPFLHNGQSLMKFYRIVLLNDELPNVPPNSYGTLAKRKREKVYSRGYNVTSVLDSLKCFIP